MSIEIISIGDELLIGQVVNTNASTIAEKMTTNGFNVSWITTVSDDPLQIKQALSNANKRSDVVIATGGLGPTTDDITKNALTNYFGGKLIFDDNQYRHVQQFFEKRAMPMLESNRQQAYVPDKATILSNEIGTAPGLLFMKDQTHFIFLPGVPFEMIRLIEKSVIPFLKGIYPITQNRQKTLLTFGLGESFLAEKISDIEASLPSNIKIAYLPSPQRVRVRLTANGSDDNKVNNDLDFYIDKIKNRIPDLVFGEDDQKMEEVTGEMLRSKGITLATAESCTGGAIARLITSVAGSSDYFKGSILAYSNEIKTKYLGITEEMLMNHGAVSETVVKTMAEYAALHLKTDAAIATSGIAGPSGGTPDKPVGTVWIAVTLNGKTKTVKKVFGSDRQRNILRASYYALNLLRLELLNN